MPRKLHIPQSVHPYHVTARAHNGSWFRISDERAWKIMSHYLNLVTLFFNVKVHSFVMMNNHFHLVISTPDANLSEAMNYFMRESSKEINRQTNQTNQVYGGRYFRSMITSNLHFEHVYKYVYRNPVTAGISKSCEEYPFSTLNGLLGFERLTISVEEDSILFSENVEKILEWLNKAPELAHYELLKRGLSRRVLKFPKNRGRTIRHRLEQTRY